MATNRVIHINRREFFKLSGVGGAGLVIGYLAHGRLNRRTSRNREPWIWVKISPDGLIADGLVSVVIPRCEMGQGAMTALAMIVAEELNLDWSKIQTEWAPPQPEVYGELRAAASDAIRSFWDPLRKSAAIARTLLVAVAAKRWGVAPGTCQTHSGAVIHAASGRVLAYGSLVTEAAAQPLPWSVQLKSPEDYTLIGRSLPRLDLPSKVDATAVFGIDVSLPGLLTATIVHCPVSGGRLVGLDVAKAKAIAGVRHVVALEPNRYADWAAVAVVADGFWAAQKGVAALAPRWDEGPNASVDTEGLIGEFQAMGRGRVQRFIQTGDPEAAPRRAASTIEAAYFTPHLAHATMEPMNCTARVEAGRCEIWVPTQDPVVSRDAAAHVCGIPVEQVVVHQTYLGGGFGRRQRVDYVAQAVQIAKTVRAPVKLIWTREQDIRHGFYRPASVHFLKAGLDAQGQPSGWTHRVAGESTLIMLLQGIDDLPYAIKDKRIEVAKRAAKALRCGPWRGLARSQNAYVTECFLDELARAGGHDPFQLRRHLLRDARRHLAVLERAAKEAGWGQPLAEGRHRGIAMTDNFHGICAEVAEVSVAADGAIRVHRIVCAADCGRLVHPDSVVAQMEGGILFGLTAALKGEITLAKGRVQQSNFHDYPMLRMSEVPEIEVHLISSTEPPGGVGETSLPPVAPAVANAVAAATGQPVRRLPIKVGTTTG